MTWKQSQRFFALLAGVTMTIALGFTFMGFWPILPFAGLELGLLWLALWWCANAGQQTEVVSVRESSVLVEKGKAQVQPVWESPRTWAQVRLQRSRIDWYPSRLVLRAGGREVAVGDFLVEEERRELAGRLRSLVGDGYRR